MREEEIQAARILIVDDQPVNTRLLERMLARVGFSNLLVTNDSREVPRLFESFRPDLVILDLIMPHLDGFEVMAQLGERIGDQEYLPILVISSEESDSAKERALAIGAKDFLNKAFKPAEVVLRIRNLLLTRLLYQQIQRQNQMLEGKVRERTAELESANQRLIQAEADKKRFYRQVLQAVTQGKFVLVEPSEIPSPGPPLYESMLAEPHDYPRLRRRIREIAVAAGMEETPVGDFVLAVGEAATNAIKHAVGARCEVYQTDEKLIARVEDRGKGIEHDALPSSILMAGFSTDISMGMGYTLILQLVDYVWLSTAPGGTIIQLEKWIHPEHHMSSPLLTALARF